MGIPYAEVIGDPIAHSKSPTIHKFWLEKLGLEGDYRATLVTPAELPEYLAARRADPDWRGCNVTMPHKETVMPFLDRIEASTVRAVNSIVPYEGGLRGFNTDGAGVDEAIIDWQFGKDNSRICLIGAGGGARSAIAELDVLCYFTFDIVARDETKGWAFLESCDVEGQVYSFERAGEAMAGRDAVINASPLGMVGFPPMPEAVLSGLAQVGRKRWLGSKRRGYALDMVTTPPRTAFVERAQGVGLNVSDGLAILIGQAHVAFIAFFGTEPSREHDLELRKLLTS